MALPGTNQDGTATIDEGTEHTFTCLVQGTRPAASIKWFLNGEMQYTGTVAPPSVDDNELYDTTGSWSFTPSRDNHRQEILCQASTTESQTPLPNVTAILNVNGMYILLLKPLHTIGKVSVNASILYTNQEICNKTNL